MRKKLRTSRRGNLVTASVSLKGLPKGKFTVTISATTFLGRHLSGRRSYHTCAKKAIRRKASTKLR
jgi:hypothetical protein